MQDEITTTGFMRSCVNTKFSNPLIDDGIRWCRLKEGYFECAYTDRWNECPDFKTVQQAMRELHK